MYSLYLGFCFYGQKVDLEDDTHTISNTVVTI